MPRGLITVVETPVFVRQATDIWDDPEREAFVDFIAANPEAGDVIPDTGGGARVIYFYHAVDRPVYLLMVYAKARREDLTPEERRSVREIAARLKGKSK